MKHINKIISLEPFKTRLPLVYPAYKDGQVNYVNSSNIKVEPNANWGNIPLNINEYILGAKYSSFTTQMGAAYEGKTLTYEDIREWMNDYSEWLGYISEKGCGERYTSAVEYSDAKFGKEYYNRDYYVDLDTKVTLHGGKRFYTKMLDVYLRCVDLRTIDKPDTYSKAAWNNIINHWDSPILTYQVICSKSAWLYEIYEKYGDIKTIAECKGKQNYNDCVEYVSLGGKTMYDILSIKRITIEDEIETLNEKISSETSSLVPNISLDICLSKSFENLGNLKAVCEEYIAGVRYKPGDVVIYENNAYYLDNGGITLGGSKLNSQTGKYEFDTDHWVLYDTMEGAQTWYANYYTDQYYDEFHSNDSSERILTGYTVSSLRSLKRENKLEDVFGNEMPGWYEQGSGDTIPYPSEGETLDIEYEIGNVANTSYISGSTYNGDILYAIHFYYNDANGNRIDDTLTKYEYDETTGEKTYNSPLQAIMKCESLKDSYKEAQGLLMCDFIYYVSTYIDLSEDIPKILNKSIGIKMIDTCKLEQKNCLFCTDFANYYNLKYYEIQYNEKTIHSQDQNRDAIVEISEFTLLPGEYKKNVQNIPIFRDDSELGMSYPQRTESNIYIDRGYATAIDKHLKLGEVTSLETLENYGNGAFNLISLT